MKAVFGLLACGALAGCASIGFVDGATVATVNVGHHREERIAEDLVVQATVTGGTLAVAIKSRCDVLVTPRTRRTVVRDHNNQSPGTTWVIAGGSVVALGAGAVLVADASKVYGNDASGASYNPVGPTPPRVAGGALIGLGAVLGVIAIADVLRANSSETADREETGSPAIREGGCSGTAVAGAAVGLRHGTTKIPIGETNEKGVLRVKLEAALATHAPRMLTDSVELVVRGDVIQTLDVGAVKKVIDDARWAAAHSELCNSPKNVHDCDGVLEYHADYANHGAHSAEANAALAAANPTLTALRDEKAWSVVDVKGCAQPTSSASCDTVDSYLAEFSDGKHASDARALLKKSAVKIAALKKAEGDLVAAKVALAYAQMPPFTLSSVKTRMELPTDYDPAYSVELKFIATRKKSRSDLTYFHGRGRCRVGSKNMIGSGHSLDSLAALDVGDSRNVTLHFFGGLGDGLASMPEWCELTVTVGNVLEATDTIETLCYRPQQSLESGTCK